MNADIPRTGRIGRFARLIEKEVNQEALTRIMQDSSCFEFSEQARYCNAEKAPH